MHADSDLSYFDSRFTALENMVKGFVGSQPQFPSPSLMSCSQCQSMDHTLSACPHFAHQLASSQEQVNAAYQRPRFDPYSSTYHEGWKYHPSLSYGSGPNAMSSSSQGGRFPRNTTNLAPAPFYPTQAYHGVPSAPSQLPPPVSHSQPPPGYTDFDKLVRLMNSNNEKLMKTMNEQISQQVSLQMSQLAIPTRKPDTFPSQPEVNPTGGTSLPSGSNS